MCVFFGQVLRYVGVVDVLKGSARVELRSYERGSALGGLSYNDNLISISSDRYSPQPLVIQVCVRARRRRACVRLFCARVSSSGCVSEPHTPSLPPSPSLPPPHSLPHTHAGPGSRLGAHGVGRLCGPAAPQPPFITMATTSAGISQKTCAAQHQTSHSTHPPPPTHPPTHPPPFSNL